MGMLDFGAQPKESAASDSNAKEMKYPIVDGNECAVLCQGSPYNIIAAHLGELKPNSIVNFWTLGRYAMHHVLRYILNQTGPADVVSCTWAISTRAVDDLLALRNKGLLRSFMLWIDPRVKVINPEPLQMLQLNWPVAIAPVHAKVTTISNEKWKIVVFGSMNFTTSPQPERGAVCTIPSMYDVDNKILMEVFGNEETD